MNIGFYCRSGETVGYGHLSRAANLAAGFLAGGDQVCFWVEGEWPDFIEPYQRCASVAALIANSAVVIFDGVEAAVIDRVLGDYQRPVLAVQIDDMGNYSSAVDVIINPNIYGDELSYPTDKVVLAGPAFNLIAPALFSGAAHTEKKHRILVSFGGSDRGQYGIPVASLLSQQLGPVTLALACRRDQCDGEVLTALEQQGVTLLFNQKVVAWLPECLLYVGAAGVTSQEALAAGCRIVVCAIVPNQQPNITALHAAGYRAIDSFDPERLLLQAEQEWRQPTVVTELLSGSGIGRIVDELKHRVVLQMSLPGELG